MGVCMVSNLLFSVLTCLFFISDLCVHGFYGTPRCFLVATLFYTLVDSGTSRARLLVLIVGMLYESFLVTGVIGNDLIVIIPLAWIVSYARQRIHLFLLVDALLVFLSVGIIAVSFFDILFLPKPALVRVILFHFISALSMVYYIKR